MSKCCCNKRVISNAVINGCGDGNCIDVCSNPQCGDPEFLTVLAPVVYDEIGINICRTITVPEGVLADFPTATHATVEVIDIAFTVNAEDSVTINPITARANCYEIELTNLSVTFALRLYDCCDRLLGTLTLPGIIYLPSDTTDPGYDADTNPSLVALELFAPYGVVYTDGAVATPALNFIGFSTTNSQLNQGLNLMAIPKALDFDLIDGTITVGLTLIVKSIYFTQYQIPHNGKAVVSKGSLTSQEESVCMEFVSGSLLDRNIKPLEICNLNDAKNDCDISPLNPCDCQEPLSDFETED